MPWPVLSSERWQNERHVCWSRRTQVLVLLGLVVGFVVFRWVLRREPLNSDDMILFASSVDAAAGHHWIFGSAEVNAELAGFRIPHAVHTAFRIGLLPLGVPAVKLLGASSAAYYLVPLLFSALGFVALYWVMLTHFGPLTALVYAVIHIAWPFELEHASLFLTDLPAAATGILSFCLLDASTRRGPRGRMAWAVLAGLAAWETYLLRNNGLVLLLPAYLAFLWCRPTRVQTLWALGVALVGVLSQQVFLAYRDFGWGDDWLSARRDFAEYAPFLPVYSWGSFLVRQFTYQLTTFGKGFTGAVAALLVLGSLGFHVLLLRFERRVLLVAIAVFGLVSWLVFSFSIYERVPGGVRATVPVSFRFIQPFTYSSLVVLAWASCSLRERLAAAGLISSAPSSAPSVLRQRLAGAALPALLVAFSLTALVVRGTQTYRQGATRRLVDTIRERASGSDTPLVIAGTEPSLNVPQLFCCDALPSPVEWRGLPLGDLGELVERDPGALVLRAIARELSLARYHVPEARQAYRAELGRIEGTLWREFDLAHVDATYALFIPLPPGNTLPVPSRNEWAVPSSPPPSDPQLLEKPACREREGEDTWRMLEPARVGGSRASCEYTWLSDGRLLTPDLSHAEANGSGFVLRLHADYDVPLKVTVNVVQHAEHGVRRQRASVPTGTSYVPVRLQAGARALSLTYRVRTGGAPEGQVVRLRPAEWRPYRFVGDDGRHELEAPVNASAP